jgi:hypothetical protein
MARWPFRTLPRPGAGRFSQQKVFQDKLLFAGDGPLQIQHAVLRLTVSGPTFALTTWYRALQFGQRKSGDLFGLGMSARNIFASLRAASIRAPREAKLVTSHNLRRLNAVPR